MSEPTKYARLLKRLRTAAGMGTAAIGSMASGPCGGCWEAYDARCVAQSDIDEWRAANEGAEADGCPNLAEFRRYATARGSPRPTALLSSDAGDYPREAEADDCCYAYTHEFCAEGRPFLVGGRARVGALRAAPGPAHVAALADAWRDAALAEHASVAAFARLALELLHHGAPLELVAQAQLASLDEIRHAEICKRHGEALTGTTWHFGPLPTNGCMEDTSLLGLLERNIVEGCIGETIAACLARERALRAADPALRDDLMRIADDEGNHAALAFNVLAWILAQEPALRAATSEIFHTELSRLRELPEPSAEAALFESDRGHLPTRDAHAIRIEVSANVLQPLGEELGGPSSSTA